MAAPGGATETPTSTPFPALSRARDLSGDGGVRKAELRPGSGRAVPPGASVAVKYSGYFEHKEEPFCTNCHRRFPGLMKLGKDITLQGLEIGLLTMKKGEVAKFVFAPDYAYGQRGCPPLIPPSATVMFEVELLDFLDTAESDMFFELTAEQQDAYPLQKVLKVADTERKFGNYLYRKRLFQVAKDRYKRAFSILGRTPSSEVEQRQIDASKLLVLLNLSLTYLKLERPAQALAYGEKALDINQSNAKALFRCGQLLQGLHGEGERNVLPDVCLSQLFFWLIRNKGPCWLMTRAVLGEEGDLALGTWRSHLWFGKRGTVLF
ncbi:inactive peptidyl-prolyl cis-trans isomerase FKBP6 isoform X3 [Cuculus canorus]|uniref:inactive peptidyl-prolyl cis-trans isomerase FKBP6 isoform X3 n=1 Tax=Cuculus canorus TaxID=55661 RepID=UPI0023AA82E0|nr:inactive peptidyl-prolyl cis-trans isomerase FKBP6 isoform X3 [Cuculus canorus]